MSRLQEACATCSQRFPSADPKELDAACLFFEHISELSGVQNPPLCASPIIEPVASLASIDGEELPLHRLLGAEGQRFTSLIEPIFELLLRADPTAAKHPDACGRLPLHVLCAGYQSGLGAVTDKRFAALSVELLAHYPRASDVIDRKGMTPSDYLLCTASYAVKERFRKSTKYHIAASRVPLSPASAVGATAAAQAYSSGAGPSVDAISPASQPCVLTGLEKAIDRKRRLLFRGALPLAVGAGKQPAQGYNDGGGSSLADGGGDSAEDTPKRKCSEDPADPAVGNLLKSPTALEVEEHG
ncbi:hypothetical protein T492DRAFT_860742 [Pavlovales sp. CCMP2436]|nr:hypothetical protein T492DRAFT_860742 [Pavlovales sp. CCMP2436]